MGRDGRAIAISRPQERLAGLPSTRKARRSSVGRPIATGLALSAAAIAGWVLYSRRYVQHNLMLPLAVDGELRWLTGRAGRIGFYDGGQGRPVLAIHSINAAASAYEMRPIFEELTRTSRVYAMDLPGFGQSDRYERRYDARLYTDAILDMAGVIYQETREKIDAIALSLSSEYLAMAALERPDLFRSLTLITPTGFEADLSRRVEREGLRKALRSGLLRRPLFDLLTTQPSIKLNLMAAFGSTRIDPGMVRYDYLTSHQPGAENAVYDFVSGIAWTRKPRELYEQLELPVWVPYGKRAMFHEIDHLGFEQRHPNWSFEAFNCGAFPHFQRRQEFFASLDRFFARPLSFAVREAEKLF